MRSDEGDEWLKIAGMKLIVDGGFEGGRMREPYEEPYGKDGTFRGLQLMPQDRYTEIVKELNRLGWRVGTHAVGDAAIDEVLAGYEAANRERSITGSRWAIEHGFLPRQEHFARINALGVFVTVQDHLYLAGPSLVHYWGGARAAWVTPVRAYLGHRVEVAAGTDAPVVPFQPLWTIYHFVGLFAYYNGQLTLPIDAWTSGRNQVRFSWIDDAGARRLRKNDRPVAVGIDVGRGGGIEASSGAPSTLGAWNARSVPTSCCSQCSTLSLGVRPSISFRNRIQSL
ncbi:MAG: amidohydrolase family protein [Acidobacteriia bacterium]|nr:amidohydrolase family protein [Terriglobia bacterium]